MVHGGPAPKAKAGLDLSPAEDGFIVFHPDLNRVHFLNHSAVLILELCTGQNSAREIAALVQEAYSLPEPPDNLVEETVASLLTQGLLDPD